ncbi:MAG TPA: hypothetical protein VNY31_08730 [Solirubrobacteraceae bacterium]|jgi:hypothetical protein|nr:hypothetical protein [Solirubrobacteraceae bacterium]
MFHVELRQFPHNACAFNLIDAELAQIVGPWSREQWIELGERKWNPHQARMTVLEGPHLPVEDLAMGRGWRNAQHQSEDVTERVIARARGADENTELQPLLGPDPTALLQAWRLAAQRRPELSPSESLALAESTLHSLDTPQS